MPSTKTDTALAAASVVGVADQIIQGVRDSRERRSDAANGHYLKAAIAGAIAIGAFKLLKDEEEKQRAAKDGHTRLVSKHPQPPVKESDHDGHTRDLLVEALGAYAMGRQMMGHNDHKILKLVAEGLGAAAFAKEVDQDLVE